MDEEPPAKRYPPSVSKMSKTPSWVMLGFVLGALFVMALPNEKPEPAPVAAVPPVQPAQPTPPPRDPPPLSRIEAVFEEWGKHAVWHENSTEVALWDPAEERYADFYEVRRIDGVLYFRSIPKLTRRVIERTNMGDSPLLFTETEEQFRAWDERDRAQRPLERMWKPPPPKLPQVEPQRPAVTMPVAPEAQRVVPPPWKAHDPAGAESKK